MCHIAKIMSSLHVPEMKSGQHLYVLLSQGVDMHGLTITAPRRTSSTMLFQFLITARLG